MQTIKVKASREYEVQIHQDFNNLAESVKGVFSGSKILLLTDSNVSDLYSKEVLEKLKDFNVYTYVIPAGERSKNITNFALILEYMAKNNFSREDLVFSLGGGVVGDLAGFVASSYMRGVKFIQCPTTLLAQVDSSVGGKTAVNLEQGKNLVGAFYQPILVYVNVSTLKTLPQSELTNGFGEIVKYGFISKSVSKKMIQEKDYNQLIANCIKIKAQIVNEDEYEKGLRAVLNLGHTIGHAIESLSGYTISHGLCVAKGINKIIQASKNYYRFDDCVTKELYQLLNSYNFDLEVPYSNKQILEKINNDKKADNKSIKAVLINEIGKVEIVKMPIEQLGELLNEV